MEEVTQWDTMSDKEKVRLILQHVMGCDVLDEEVKGYSTPDVRAFHRRVERRVEWPIAFWNTDGEVWCIKQFVSDATYFDPLRDMNDAWLIVRHFASLPDEPFASHWRKRLFMHHLDIPQCDSDTFYDITLPILASLTPKKICKAALEAMAWKEDMRE